MPSTCSAVDLTQLKKVSDLQVNRNSSNKNTKKNIFLKRVSKSCIVMSNSLIKSMTYSKPQIQEVQKTKKDF